MPYNPLIHRIIEVSSADYRNGKGQSRLGTLIKTLQFSRDQTAYNELSVGCRFYIERYLKFNPDEKEFICNQAELDDKFFIR